MDVKESSLLEARLPNSNRIKQENNRKKILQGTIKGYRRQYLRIYDQDYIANIKKFVVKRMLDYRSNE